MRVTPPLDPSPLPHFQVWTIKDFVAKWIKATEGKGSEHPTFAAILLGEIDTCQRCLPYLKGCMRGAGWEDLPWLQVRGGGACRGRAGRTHTGCR